MDKHGQVTDTALYRRMDLEGSVGILVPKLQMLPCFTPRLCPTQSGRSVQSHFLFVLKREILQLLEGDKELRMVLRKMSHFTKGRSVDQHRP